MNLNDFGDCLGFTAVECFGNRNLLREARR
jgi:hypothetical protein